MSLLAAYCYQRLLFCAVSGIVRLAWRSIAQNKSKNANQCHNFYGS
jgi:hypothetical protein